MFVVLVDRFPDRRFTRWSPAHEHKASLQRHPDYRGREIRVVEPQCRYLTPARVLCRRSGGYGLDAMYCRQHHGIVQRAINLAAQIRREAECQKPSRTP